MPRLMQEPLTIRLRGVSLIELLVAMALGIILIAGVIQLFMGSRMTYMSNEAQSRVQENGRFALEALKPELRGAGSGGFCAARINITSHLDPNCSGFVDLLFDPTRVVTGWEYDGTDPGSDGYELTSLDPDDAQESDWTSRRADGTTEELPDSLSGRVVPGSDVLTVRSTRVLDVEVDSWQNNNQLDTTGNLPSEASRAILMVTDCNNADVFQQANSVSSIQKPNEACNRPPGLSPWSTTTYDDRAQVLMSSVHAYYIGFNAARGEPGLYRLSLPQGLAGGTLRPEELVEGVENMQLLYGYSLPGDQGGDGQEIFDWYPADEVPDWGLVTAVRIGLSVRSPENADMDAIQRTMDLAGTNVTIALDERRLRHDFSATVALRNRYIVH